MRPITNGGLPNPFTVSTCLNSSSQSSRVGDIARLPLVPLSSAYHQITCKNCQYTFDETKAVACSTCSSNFCCSYCLSSHQDDKGH